MSIDTWELFVADNGCLAFMPYALSISVLSSFHVNRPRSLNRSLAAPFSSSNDPVVIQSLSDTSTQDQKYTMAPLLSHIGRRGVHFSQPAVLSMCGTVHYIPGYHVTQLSHGRENITTRPSQPRPVHLLAED